MARNNYKKETTENKLRTIIQNDNKLTPENKIEWQAMGNLFSLDFKDNLSLSSLELDENYGCGIDAWKDFINYPPIKKYLTSFRDERLLNTVDNLMAEGKGGANALKVKESISLGKDDNSRLILFRLPEKIEVFEGEFENGITRENF